MPYTLEDYTWCITKMPKMEAREFGARLRELRIQARLTQRELADKVSIDFSYLSKIENGVLPPPSEKVILRLVEVLNADKDELLTLAGKVPSDIRQMLKNREALQLLRSDRAQKMVGASNNKRAAAHPMKNPLSGVARTRTSTGGYRNVARVALATFLALLIGTSLWFVSPTRALELTINNPGSGTLGGTFTFTITVSIADQELVPIQQVDAYIYRVGERSTYEATLLGLRTRDYTTGQTGGGTATVVATPGAGWTQSYGYGYANWQGTPYRFGYGYGYGYGAGATSITYTIDWTPPTGWPTGSYEIETELTANGSTFSQTSSSFNLGAAGGGGGGGGGGAPPATTAAVSFTDLSLITTNAGVTTADVIATSEDGRVELTIDKGTTAWNPDELEAISGITIAEMLEPPAPPEDSTVIGLTYALGPDGATFDPPITLTFTYDPDTIPEGVNEEALVIAMWDEDAGEWTMFEGATVDPVTHTITVSISHFTAFTVLARTGPASFTVSTLTISPAEVSIAEELTISLLVANTGDLPGTHDVNVLINGEAVSTIPVTLAGGASQTVTFTTTSDVGGTFIVSMNGLTGEFTIREAPTPIPIPTPTPTPPPPAPPTPAPPPPAAPINWWLIGGMIAVAAASATVTWRWVSERSR
jgi:transcriptional regulator with XRE-family HTH domain